MKWDPTPAPLGPSVSDKGLIDPDDRAPSAWLRLGEVTWHLPRLLAGMGPLGPRGPENGDPSVTTARTISGCARASSRA